MTRTPAQDHLISVVAADPGIRPWRAAVIVGPYGSANYGYRTINRAIKAGRIVNVPDPNRPDWGQLFTVEEWADMDPETRVLVAP